METGCPPQFVEMLKQLHHNMMARVNVNGSLSEPISFDNGEKKGDIPTPTLFSMYFAVMLSHAFHDCDIVVYIHSIISSKVANFHRFNSKLKNFSFSCPRIPFRR